MKNQKGQQRGYFTYVLLLFALISLSHQQQESNTYHLFIHTSAEDQHAFYNIPAPKKHHHHHNDTKLKPFQFATSIPVSILFKHTLHTNSVAKKKDFWQWKVKIRSFGALSLSLIFDQWYLPPDTEIYIYNKEQILGAYQSSFNKNVFATAPLTGDSIVLEYFSPYHIKEMPKIRISRVVYGIKALPSLLSLPSFNTDLFMHDEQQQHVFKPKRRPRSGKCNIDLSCDYAGEQWADEGNAVVVLLTNENQVYCTGVLVNNAQHNGRQFLLTAHHCFVPESNPATDIVMFKERKSCFGYRPTSIDTVQGLSYLSGSSVSDYALFEIQEKIPKDYNVYLAGWSTISEPIPPLVGIHHPSGDFKKLSIYNGHLLPTCWSECPERDHWKVERWTRGTTEPGSSGSPLFDASHRIVGQLHGGSASCWNKNGYDVYGSFAASWENGLSVYLDPDNLTTISSLNGLDGIYLNDIFGRK